MSCLVSDTEKRTEIEWGHRKTERERRTWRDKKRARHRKVLEGVILDKKKKGNYV